MSRRKKDARHLRKGLGADLGSPLAVDRLFAITYACLKGLLLWYVPERRGNA